MDLILVFPLPAGVSASTLTETVWCSTVLVSTVSTEHLGLSSTMVNRLPALAHATVKVTGLTGILAGSTLVTVWVALVVAHERNLSLLAGSVKDTLPSG